jgi:hypothetical protein
MNRSEDLSTKSNRSTMHMVSCFCIDLVLGIKRTFCTQTAQFSFVVYESSIDMFENLCFCIDL